MSIIAGGLAPDSGEITLDGRPIRPGSPHAALEAGVAAVHQTPLLFDHLTWEENIALGGFSAKRFNPVAAASAAESLAARLGFKLPPSGGRVDDCSLGERVRLEIILALSFDPRVLVLDEPTGMLGPGEIAAFLDLLRALRASNRAVILVTHRIAEARAVADRITILRDGRVVASIAPADIDDAGIAALMVGQIPARSAHRRETASDSNRPALEITNLSVERDGRRVLDGINLAVRPGEIVAMAGVEGNGQTELVEVIAGVIAGTAGSVTGDGFAIIPQDRDRDGLVLMFALWENLLLDPAWRARLSSNGRIKRAEAIAQCRQLTEKYSIRAAGPSSTAASLSGGNRQRMQAARAIASGRRVIVAHDLWRGLDVAATASVSAMIVDYAAAGGAVLLVGGDLDELLAIRNRLFVINTGRIREAAPADRTADRLGLLMSGPAN